MGYGADTEQIRQRMNETAERLAECRAELARARFTGQSDDEHIAATVDASGRLVDLRIDPRVFRRPDSEGLAEAILEATRAAEDSAKTHTRSLFRDVLGPAADVDPAADDDDRIKQAITELGRRAIEGPEESRGSEVKGWPHVG